MIKKPNFGPGVAVGGDVKTKLIRKTIRRTPILWADLVTRLGIKRTDKVYVELEDGTRLMLDISCRLYAEEIEEEEVPEEEYAEADPAQDRR